MASPGLVREKVAARGQALKVLEKALEQAPHKSRLEVTEQLFFGHFLKLEKRCRPHLHTCQLPAQLPESMPCNPGRTHGSHKLFGHAWHAKQGAESLTQT